MTGLIGGTALIAGGVYSWATATCYSDFFCEESYGWGVCVVGFGLLSGVACFLIGNHYSKKAADVQSLFGLGRNFNNGSSLSLSMEAMGTYYNPGIGIGVRYNF